MIDLDEAKGMIDQALDKLDGVELDQEFTLTTQSSDEVLNGHLTVYVLRPSERWKVNGFYSESIDSELHESYNFFQLVTDNLVEFLVTHPMSDNEVVNWGCGWDFHVFWAKY